MDFPISHGNYSKFGVPEEEDDDECRNEKKAVA